MFGPGALLFARFGSIFSRASFHVVRLDPDYDQTMSLTSGAEIPAVAGAFRASPASPLEASGGFFASLFLYTGVNRMEAL